MKHLPAIAIGLVLASAASADELRTLDGKTVTGTVTRISDSEITIATDTGDVASPLAQVLAVDLRPGKGIDLPKYIDLRLIDDALLHCAAVAVKGKEVEATLPSGLVLKLPMSSVAALQNDAGNKDLTKRWNELSRPGVQRDRLLILRDGELNVLEGLLGEADAEGKTIQFKRDGADAYVPVVLERVHGLVFWRPDPPAATPICKVIDRDGNALFAVKLAYEKDTLTVHTTFGAKVALKNEALSRLDFNFGRLTYLSDLEPAKTVEKSGIGLVVRYKKDVNLDGEPILFDGKQYTKGLSMHAHTELEYALGGKYKTLKGLLGVDTRVGADSQALVTIWCDGDKRYSKVITPNTPADDRNININVNDVQTLRIVVAARNFLDLHDHVSFADARVSQ
ncbi:MAG: NPCBM/NEW2 domain-containing protein [Gemmataceae bacterium]|nr:NPCBM/NEW2 domain-containing protein [Gemmataceae bacterium]